MPTVTDRDREVARKIYEAWIWDDETVSLDEATLVLAAYRKEIEARCALAFGKSMGMYEDDLSRRDVEIAQLKAEIEALRERMEYP